MRTGAGTVLAVSHEPLSFLRRSGQAGVNEESRFLRDHSEDSVRKLAENGCNLVRFHFYKGFGVETEGEEMEMAREYIKLCHKHGVKVELYVQVGTLHPETLLVERPDMLDWVQTDNDGKPITLVYGHQSCRLYPCFNREGYWDYLERVIQLAVVAGADALGFDNITTGEEPFVCHCPSCKKAFTGYLKDKYRPDTAEGAKLTKERFGHTVLDHMQPPTWNYFNHPYNLTEIRNPVTQEWVLFRCDSLKKILKRLYDHAKGLNPDILLEFNTYKQFGVNTAFVHGVYVPDYMDCIDAFWNECDEAPGITPEGELYSKIRSFKMGAAMGKDVFTNHPFDSSAEDRQRLAYAECMAFNRGVVSGVDRVEGIYSGRQAAFKSYKRFAEEHEEIYGAEPAPNVALFESKPSLSFNNCQTWYANMTMQQGLLRGHIPYALIFSLDDLEKYRAVVLPDVECLSADEITHLESYARNGGALIMTDDTGKFDHWHRRWEGSSLLAVLGIEKEKVRDIHTCGYGAGKLVYIPNLKSTRVFEPEKLVFTAYGTNQPGLGPEFLRAPVGLDGIVDAIRHAAGESLPVEIIAPEHVIIEFGKDRCGERHYVHLINYKPGTEVEGIRIRFSRAVAAEAHSITPLSPDTGPACSLEPDDDGWYAVPALKCYMVLEI